MPSLAPRRSSFSTPPSSTAPATSTSASPPPPSAARDRSPKPAPSAASAYTASLPATYRRSSFPVSPAVHAPNAAPFLPGLSLEMRGCRDDDDFERATGSKAPYYSAFGSHAQAQARTGSVSSETSSASSGSGVFDRPALASSRSSLSSEGSTVPWLGDVAGRSWSLNSGLEKKKREAIKGWEDPALAAARRALWEDVGATVVPEVTVIDDGDEAVEFEDEAVSRKGGEAGPDQAEAGQGDEEEEEEEGEEEDDDDWSLRPARPPCHSTLAPGPSCLRSRTASASPSPRFAALSLDSSVSSSSCSTCPPLERGSSPSPSSECSETSCTSTSQTAPSIRFSPDPPLTCPTYSAKDYERKGDLPVEKLSIREWIELQGVREAVGVWSGKIGKWAENDATPAGTAENSSFASSSDGSSGSTVTNGSTSTRDAKPPTDKSLCPLAAVVGVVTVSKSAPNSPTQSPRSPASGFTYQPGSSFR
ncbi:hypothetical protein JCM10212_007082 [Sporobolomyces blumeae]